MAHNDVDIIAMAKGIIERAKKKAADGNNGDVVSDLIIVVGAVFERQQQIKSNSMVRLGNFIDERPKLAIMALLTAQVITIAMAAGAIIGTLSKLGLAIVPIP